jgi:hypothetical protein
LRTSVEYGPERAGAMDSAPAEPAGARKLRLDVTLPCRTTNKGFALGLDLLTSPLAREPAWRR